MTPEQCIAQLRAKYAARRVELARLNYLYGWGIL